MAVETVTIPDVPLVRAGTWGAVTGPTTVTTADLQDMLAAASDPEVDSAPIKIGHYDSRFSGDGEPALGWIKNLRVIGDRIVGDLVDVPAKLAEIIPKALRRRSVEIAWDVTTPSGKAYRAVISALALLGVTPPAVKGLEDLLSRYAAGQIGDVTELLVIDEAANQARALVMPSGVVAAHLSGGAETGPRDAQVESEAIVTDEQIRSMFGLAADAPITDQMRTIANAQGGQGGQPAGGTPTAPQANGGQPVANPPDPAGGNGQNPLPPPPPPPPPAPPGSGGEQTDANRRDEASTGQPPAGSTTPGAAPAAGSTPPASLAAGMIPLTPAELAELQRQARDGAEARRLLAEQERERVLGSMLSQGKFATTEIDFWRGSYDRDPQGTVTFLAGRPAVFATSELGSPHAAEWQPGPADQAQLDAALAGLFPEIASNTKGS